MSKTSSSFSLSLVATAALLMFSTAEAHTPRNNWEIEQAKELAKSLQFDQQPTTANSKESAKSRTTTPTSSSCPQSTSGHRIDSLPYWAMEQELPCMYSGNLLSSDKYENYFFYWLAPRPDDLAADSSSSDSSPLIVYLNGGPGSTSMNALWTGNGPLRVSQTGSSAEGEDFEITYDTTISWQEAGDLLWIDQPVGTGWSYGEHIVTTLDEIGDEFLQFMLSFYEEHPVYKERELVLTGESFAGKYLSYSSKAILDYNDDSANSFKFNLNNLILSNPLVDTPTERLQQQTVGWALGFYDDFQTDQVEVLRRHCEEGPSLGLEPADQSTACKAILNYISKPIGGEGQMDMSHFNYEDFIDNKSFTYLFTKSDKLDEIRSALHITKPEEFIRSNSTVADAITDRENNSAGVYTDLLSRGLKILINVGNYDMKDGVRSQLEWIKKIDFPDREMFDLQPRKVYTYLDQFDGSEKVGGWYRHHDNFTAIVVPQAGHMVPAFQPYLSMQYVKNFIEKGYLYCETDSNGKCSSVASDMCSYMNDCNGNGSCNSYGKCECSNGFSGPDCSTTLVDLTAQGNVEETVTASRWFYYTVPAGSGDYQFTLTSDRNVSVYIRKGMVDLPDTVTFDAVIKDDTEISFIPFMMKNLAEKGVVLAVHCVGESTDSTTFTIELEQLENVMVRNSYEFLDLAATAVPTANPVPQFERGEDGSAEKSNDGHGLMIDNFQFMIIGALLGIVATVIYYQIARFCQEYRSSRSSNASSSRCSSSAARSGAADLEGQHQQMEDPNKYIFRKVFKEDSQFSMVKDQKNRSQYSDEDDN